MMSFSGIMALGYYHVAIVGVLVGLVVAIATEPAAEVETGFADLVLAQPVSREAVITRSVVLLVICPAIVLAAMTTGTFIGLWWADRPRSPGRRRASSGRSRSASGRSSHAGRRVLVIGAASRRRAVAAGIAGGSAAALMLVDYLSRVWKPIRGIAKLSPFHYYNRSTS